MFYKTSMIEDTKPEGENHIYLLSLIKRANIFQDKPSAKKLHEALTSIMSIPCYQEISDNYSWRLPEETAIALTTALSTYLPIPNYVWVFNKKESDLKKLVCFGLVSMSARRMPLTNSNTKIALQLFMWIYNSLANSLSENENVKVTIVCHKFDQSDFATPSPNYAEICSQIKNKLLTVTKHLELGRALKSLLSQEYYQRNGMWYWRFVSNDLATSASAYKDFIVTTLNQTLTIPNYTWKISLTQSANETFFNLGFGPTYKKYIVDIESAEIAIKLVQDLYEIQAQLSEAKVDDRSSEKIQDTSNKTTVNSSNDLVPTSQPNISQQGINTASNSVKRKTPELDDNKNSVVWDEETKNTLSSPSNNKKTKGTISSLSANIEITATNSNNLQSVSSDKQPFFPLQNVPSTSVLISQQTDLKRSANTELNNSLVSMTPTMNSTESNTKKKDQFVSYFYEGQKYCPCGFLNSFYGDRSFNYIHNWNLINKRALTYRVYMGKIFIKMDSMFLQFIIMNQVSGQDTKYNYLLREVNQAIAEQQLSNVKSNPSDTNVINSQSSSTVIAASGAKKSIEFGFYANDDGKHLACGFLHFIYGDNSYYRIVDWNKTSKSSMKEEVKYIVYKGKFLIKIDSVFLRFLNENKAPERPELYNFLLKKINEVIAGQQLNNTKSNPTNTNMISSSNSSSSSSSNTFVIGSGRDNNPLFLSNPPSWNKPPAPASGLLNSPVLAFPISHRNTSDKSLLEDLTFNTVDSSRNEF